MSLKSFKYLKQDQSANSNINKFAFKSRGNFFTTNLCFAYPISSRRYSYDHSHTLYVYNPLCSSRLSSNLGSVKSWWQHKDMPIFSLIYFTWLSELLPAQKMVRNQTTPKMGTYPKKLLETGEKNVLALVYTSFLYITFIMKA